MLRLFVGLSLPDDVANQVAMLADAMPGARWVEPQNLHITLRFVGEVSEADAEDVHHNLARLEAQPFSYAISGLETFGQGRKAHALYMRVAAGPELDLLQGRVESAVVRAGQPRETRKFKPHVTLARLKGAQEDRLQSFIARNNLFRAGPIDVDHFVLYESRLGNGGSTYIPLEEYPLG
jgi:RNA 2',3'-cyclic 3'-phosphodiesterase